MEKPIKAGWGNSKLTGSQYSWPLPTSCSQSIKSLLPFELQAWIFEEQGLKERIAKVLHKERGEWFCCDKEENGMLPPLVLSFSTEMREPDKLAIRKVIWQAVQSAFTASLHLLNIMKPCSVPLVNIKRIHRLEKTTDTQKIHRQPVYQTLILPKSTWLFELWVSASCSGFHTPALNSCYILFIKDMTTLSLLAIWSHCEVKM